MLLFSDFFLMISDVISSSASTTTFNVILFSILLIHYILFQILIGENMIPRWVFYWIAEVPINLEGWSCRFKFYFPSSSRLLDNDWTVHDYDASASRSVPNFISVLVTVGSATKKVCKVDMQCVFLGYSSSHWYSFVLKSTNYRR